MKKPESTKEQLITSAGELFAEHGFGGVSTRMIADRAGVKLSGIHYHFGSKEKLYIEACLTAHRRCQLTTFADILEELLKEDPTGIILDLRHNPGGALDAVVDIADEFLPESTILVQEFGDGFERDFTASNKGASEELPLVVLIHEGSASASEVLAGAIKDNERGILIGTTTFGKGSVQLPITLSDERGSVRITIARWLTPLERHIQGIGVDPDIFVELTQEDFDAGLDPQLDAAIEYLLDQ